MRRHSLIIGVALIALTFAVAAVACGGGSGDDPDPVDATPEATAVPFDSNLLTGVVLNEGDMPQGYVMSRQFSPGNISFTSVFLGDELRYQSTAIHYATAAEADTELARNRKVIPALSAGAREENYGIPGTDVAFLYRVEGPPGLAAWAVRDNILLFIQIAPTNYENPSPRAIDDAEFARIAAIVGQRTATLVDAPERITPVTGATIAPPVVPSTTPGQ